MWALATAWPEPAIVQRVVAQLPWGQNIAFLEHLDKSTERLWYAKETIQQGWSKAILALQIEGKAHERQGTAISNPRGLTQDLNPKQSPQQKVFYPPG